MSGNMEEVKAMMPETVPDKTDVKAKAARPKWLLPVVAACTAVVLVGAGFAGYHAYSAHELDAAKAACTAAADRVRESSNSYHALVNGKAADASGVKTDQVKDAKTVDALKSALKASTPEYAGCVADDKTGLDDAAAVLAGQADWYAKHEKSLKHAIGNVEASKLARTVDEANALLKDSDGKVADNATRDALEKAIKSKDATVIGKAMKTVNESIDAKRQADEQAQQAAAAQDSSTHAAQQQASAGSNYTGYNSYTSNGYAYPNGAGNRYAGNSGSSSNSTSGTPSQNAGSSSGGDEWITACDGTYDDGMCPGWF